MPCRAIRMEAVAPFARLGRPRRIADGRDARAAQILKCPRTARMGAKQPGRREESASGEVRVRGT